MLNRNLKGKERLREKERTGTRIPDSRRLHDNEMKETALTAGNDSDAEELRVISTNNPASQHPNERKEVNRTKLKEEKVRK
jgi:hypothetical protein